MADLILRDTDPAVFRAAIVADVRREVLAALPRRPSDDRDDSPDRLLPGSELADKLGVSESTIARRSREGSIPVIRIGTSVRFHLPSVLAALNEKGAADV